MHHQQLEKNKVPRGDTFRDPLAQSVSELLSPYKLENDEYESPEEVKLIPIEDEEPSPAQKNRPSSAEYKICQEKKGSIFQQLWMVKHKDYDPFKTPPDFEMARKHSEAKRVSRLPPRNKALDEKDCWPCWNFPFESDDFPIWKTRPKDLGELGWGFTLYFDLIKTLCFMMIVWCAWSCFALIDNYTAKNEGNWDEKLDGHFIISGTIAAHGDDGIPSIMQVWLNAFMGWTILIIYVITHLRHKNIVELIDRDTITPSDFTIYLRKLPKDATEKEIKTWIEQNGLPNNRKAAIDKVTMAYDIDEFSSLTRKYVYWLLLSEKRSENTKWLYSKEKWIAKYEHFKQRIQNLLNEKEVEFSGKAFVTFKWEEEAKLCLSNFTNPKRNVSVVKRVEQVVLRTKTNDNAKFNGHKCHVSRPDEPSDILWENLGERKAFRRRVKTEFAILWILGICFAVIWASSEWKKQMDDDSSNDLTDEERTKLRIFAFIPAIVISIINVLLEKAIQSFTELEKFDSLTKQNLHFSFKLWTAQFLNTAIIPLIVYRDPDDWYAIDGLIAEVYNIVIANAILSPLLYAFEVDWILSKILQKWYERQGEKWTLNQQEANELFQGPELRMAILQARLMKTYLLAMFYGPILPIAYPITAISFIVEYWVDKYILIRRTPRPEAIGKYLVRNISRLFPVGVFFNCISSMVFYYKYDHDALTTSVLGLVVAFIFLMWPWQRGLKLRKMLEAAEIIYKINAAGIEFEKQKAFDKQVFLFDYDRENPIHAMNAQKLWLHRLQSHWTNEQIQLLAKIISNRDSASILDKHTKRKLSSEIVPKTELMRQFTQVEAKNNLQLRHFVRQETFRKFEFNAIRNVRQKRKVRPEEVKRQLWDVAARIRNQIYMIQMGSAYCCKKQTGTESLDQIISMNMAIERERMSSLQTEQTDNFDKQLTKSSTQVMVDNINKPIALDTAEETPKIDESCERASLEDIYAKLAMIGKQLRQKAQEEERKYEKLDNAYERLLKLQINAEPAAFHPPKSPWATEEDLEPHTL